MGLNCVPNKNEYKCVWDFNVGKTNLSIKIIKIELCRYSYYD